MLLLVLIPGIGKMEIGARSWFVIGPLSLQPAEIAKIVFIIFFAKMLSENDYNINRPGTVLILLACIAVPVLLILLQPDFGNGGGIYVYRRGDAFCRRNKLEIHCRCGWGSCRGCAGCVVLPARRIPEKQNYKPFQP